ncbi:MAG TPA: hypothetical protein VE733_09795 [Streptosporangiaceae bacterium]|nr:hypothetical protein [Streptosporangiaceae bacterium]
MSDQDQDAGLRLSQIIGQLRQRHPDWMIMYGAYSRMFWAYPLFTSLPGNYVSAADPGDLDRRMSAAEASLRHRE